MNQTKTPAATAIPPSDSRLYVGNLSPAVDEFALVALFSKFGKISKLDFLFHKSGILRGKPRGYAFVEMNRRDEALKAMVELNNKPVRGKRILVTPANESQYQEHQAANQSKTNHHHSHQNHFSHQGRPSQRGGRPVTSDPMRPTTLSILKSQQLPKGVNNKIAALEAKLASMQHNSSTSATCSSTTSNQGIAESSSSATLTQTTKPSFLPENPTLFRPTGVSGSGSQANQLLGGLPSSYNTNKSTVSINNKNGTRSSLVGGPKSSKHTTSSTAIKNPPNLEAIGLTLKEQLKRNRESKSLVNNIKACKTTHTGKVESTQLDDPTVVTSKNHQEAPSLLINPSPSSPNQSQHTSTLLDNQNQEVVPPLTHKIEEEEEKTDCFKRQKLDDEDIISLY